MAAPQLIRTTQDWTCAATRKPMCPIASTESGSADGRGRIDRFYCEHGSIVHTIVSIWTVR